jgi:signal transduction histidine kinase
MRMKLLTKTSLYYLLLSFPILILSGFICYFVITKEVKESNDGLLFNRYKLIEKYVINNETATLSLIINSKEAQINKIGHSNYENVAKYFFSDTLIFDKSEKELASNRMITSKIKVGKESYQIKIWRSTLEFDELIVGIFYLLAVILFFLFLISISLNFWIPVRLWKPFYNTLDNLKAFRAGGNEIPEFEKTNIKEFTALNKSLNSMMHKMISDYSTQKKFTENASHEIQTPLAVIKSKVDLLIQSENLKTNEVELIIAIDDACSKLTRLNQSLLLLTKIENRQFKTTEKVSSEKMIDSSLLLFEDYIQEKGIQVIKNIESDFWVNMNPDLCLVLFNNLIQNAIRHNVEKGTIIILITSNRIAIENTGKPEALNIALIFKRFQKNSNSHASIGLGLAIANEIAEVSGLIFKYKFENSKHRFIIKERDKK